MAIFPFKPNWQAGIKESLEWLTEVQTAFDGSEHRRQLREFPRRFIEASFTLHSQDKQVFENFIAAYQAQAFYIPIWQEQSRLTALANSGAGTLSLDTTNRTFQAGKQALLYASITDLELVTISSKTDTSLSISPVLVGNWPNKTLIYPCYLVRFDDTVKNALRSSKVGEVTLRFLLEENQQGISAVAYTDDVLTVRNNWARDVGSEYNRQLESVDFGVYGRFIDDESGKPTIFLDYHFLLQTIADRYAFIQHLYDLSGKWKAIWVPSGQHDLTLAGNFTSGDTSITVAYAGLSAYSIIAPKTLIKITLKNGNYYYREISNPVNNGNGTETIDLNLSIIYSFTVADVLLISYLLPMRLSADMVTLEHISSSVCSCSVLFQTVADNATLQYQTFSYNLPETINVDSFVPLEQYIGLFLERYDLGNGSIYGWAWFDENDNIVTNVNPTTGIGGLYPTWWAAYMAAGDVVTATGGGDIGSPSVDSSMYLVFNTSDFLAENINEISYGTTTGWYDAGKQINRIRFVTAPTATDIYNHYYSNSTTNITQLRTLDLRDNNSRGVMTHESFEKILNQYALQFNLADYVDAIPPLTLDLDSIKFIGTTNRGDPLTVVGEGVWSCDALANISFAGVSGYAGTLSDLSLTILDSIGNESNVITLSFTVV